MSISAPRAGTVAIALAYLGLPNALFAAGWLSPWPCALGLIAIACTFLPTLTLHDARTAGRWPPGAKALSLLAVALVWSALGGAGHLFHANTDWLVRDAVLRDLVVANWPVGYTTGDAQEWVLRAPIGYYLPAAWVGKLAGARFADPALLAWTVIGVWIFLCLATEGDATPARVALTVSVIVLFSGMDLIGTLLAGNPVTPGTRIEWWARTFQYSSNTTLLFWVPNHAVPGWIAAAIIWRQWSRPDAVWWVPAMLALLPLWSPLTALGVLPLVAVMLAWRWARGTFPKMPLAATLGSLVVVAGSGAYLTAQSSRIPSVWIWQQAGVDPVSQAIVYLLFVCLEFGILLAAILRLEHRPVLITAAATLLVLPLYRFGAGHDLAMRASIPSLAVFALSVAQVLPRLWLHSRPGPRAIAVTVILAIGVATPAMEIFGVLSRPRWAADPTTNVFEATGQAPHYVADTHGSRGLSILGAVHALPSQKPRTRNEDEAERR